MKNQFSLEYKITIGADFLTKQINREDCTINLQLWDTAGQERFASITSSFYKNAQVCILVFDLTNQKSFDDLEIWRKDFFERLNPPEGNKFPFVLIGNKSDLNDIIQVKNEDIEKYCSSHNNMIYFSCSAKNSENVEEAFAKVADLALEISNNTENDLPAIKPVQIIEETKKKKCCF